jgi:hypothetical protein
MKFETVSLITKNNEEFLLTGITKTYQESVEFAVRNKTIDTIINPANIIFKNVILIGDANNLRDINKIARIEDYLETFRANTGGYLQLHYRNYCRTLQQQKNISHLINTCPDSRMSWHSAILKVGSNICILWKRNI